jgi:spore coat protein A
MMQKLERIHFILFILVYFSAMSAYGDNTFEPFVDEIKAPPRLVVPKNVRDITITLDKVHTDFNKNYPNGLEEWGYNGTSPGPTIEVESGQPIRVHWKNRLPTTHLFAKPADVDMPMPDMSKWTHDQMSEFMLLHHMSSDRMPDVRNVTHLHGAIVTEDTPLSRQKDSDGWPDNFTIPGEEQVAEYPNRHGAQTLWYHDHAIGETGRNVAAGLVGLFYIHDKFERQLNLPSGDFEMPLIIRPRGFDFAKGSLYYSPTIFKEYYGNSMFINDKLYPFMNVEPRKYRFRILNASNARTVALRLLDSADLSKNGPAFNQIGSDGGFLEETVVLNDPGDIHENRLVLGPAERADIIVDFSKYAGRDLLLENNAFPGDRALPLYKLMLFKVGTKLTKPDTSVIPTKMNPIVKTVLPAGSVTRKIVLGSPNPDSNMVQLNGMAWMDPVTERPTLGTTEVWELIDTLIDAHPFHMHLVNFQVLDRTPFDVTEFLKSKQLVFTGPPQLPDLNERGWKDTIRAEPGMVTRIIMTFGPYPGYYVYHCHILEHEDMDMMRPFVVMPKIK